MGLRRHYSAYDINCQYGINFEKRMKALDQNRAAYPSIKTLKFPFTVRGVGKFHLPAHIESCRWRHSFHFLPGAAQGDGEAAERIWAVQNTLAASTREMSSGHRHDTINDHYSDMNVRRVHSMGEFLPLWRCCTLSEARLQLPTWQGDMLMRLNAWLR